MTAQFDRNDLDDCHIERTGKDCIELVFSNPSNHSFNTNLRIMLSEDLLQQLVTAVRTLVAVGGAK